MLKVFIGVVFASVIYENEFIIRNSVFENTVCLAEEFFNISLFVIAGND